MKGSACPDMMKWLICLGILTLTANGVYAAELAHKVVTLTDATFENLTQASTGMTTGPWFIKFYAPWCSHCNAMKEAWEKLSLHPDREGVNIAEVDVTKEQGLGRRFNITGFPTILFLHKHKVYRYSGQRNVDDLLKFCTETFEKEEGKAIPPEPTFVDYLKDGVESLYYQVTTMFQRAPLGSWFVLLGGLFGGVMVSVLVGMLFGGDKRAVSKKSKVMSKKKD